MKYEIEAVSSGSLTAARDGLYWDVSAQCSRDWDYPIRLLAETETGTVTLGVPQPEDGALRLRTRISDRSCHFTDQTRITTDQQPEQEPELEPEPQQPAEPELLPFEPEKPFDRISEFSVMDVVEQDGTLYWKAPANPPESESQQTSE